MDYGLKNLKDEVNQILGGSSDTIYFDENVQSFRIEYHCGYEVGMSLDRLIDIL